MNFIGTVTLDKVFVISLLECMKNLCTTEDAFALESFKKQGLVLVANGNILANLPEIRERMKSELIDKAVAKWNSDEVRIQSWIKEMETTKPKDTPSDHLFHWSQLVWQEIRMWCCMAVDDGEVNDKYEVTVGPVKIDDFEFICERRGFDKNQRSYLLEMLDFLQIKLVDLPVEGLTPTLFSDEMSPVPEGITETVESEEDRLRRVAAEYGMEYYKFDDKALPPYVLTVIPGEVARRYGIIPVTLYKGTLTVAMRDPSDLEALDSIRYILRLDVEGVVASKEEIDKALDYYYPVNEISNFNVNEVMVGETDEGIGPSVVE